MDELKKFGNFLIICLLGFIFYTCSIAPSSQLSERYKSELFAVEQEFCLMAKTEGIQKAFIHFAADSAVILRTKLLLKGKKEIGQHYSSVPATGENLEWAADFADVSASGDLGYTYGKYTFTSVDSLGHTSASTGIFHTVWKRQSNGKWRFVWD